MLKAPLNRVSLSPLYAKKLKLLNSYHLLREQFLKEAEVTRTGLCFLIS